MTHQHHLDSFVIENRRALFIFPNKLYQGSPIEPSSHNPPQIWNQRDATLIVALDKEID